MCSLLLLAVLLFSLLPLGDVRYRLYWLLIFTVLYALCLFSLTGVTFTSSLFLVELLAFVVTLASLALVLQDATITTSSTTLVLLAVSVTLLPLSVPLLRLDHLPLLPTILASGMSALIVPTLCWSLMLVADVLFLLVFLMLHTV